MELAAAVAAVTLTAWLVVRRKIRRSQEAEQRSYPTETDPHVVALLRSRAALMRARRREARGS